MQVGNFRLRERRQSRSRSWRVPFVAAGLLLLIGIVTFEPGVLTLFAPEPSAALPAPAAAPIAPLAADIAAPPAAPAVANPHLAPTVVPTAVPTLVPVPTIAPTLTAGALDALASIRGDLSAHWIKNHTETALRAGPNDQAQQFTLLPQWSSLRIMESRPDWLLVQYGGDGATRQAGPGWVKASDVGAIDPPTVWLSTTRGSSVWSGFDPSANRVLDVPSAALMEVIGPDFVHGTRVHVRLPGDGRQVPPAQGWVDGGAFSRTPSPAWTQIPSAYPAILTADVRLKVPYRTQLDGTDYAAANCGPTTLGMALEAFGQNIAQPDLRDEVLESEDFPASDYDAGSYIWALERVASERGVRTYGLYDSDGEYHRWSVDDVRASVRAGRPVIAQVVYRGLPGREDSGYDGDHYVVITGLMGDSFIYNDPIGGAQAKEPPGWDRVMTSEQLHRAMRASDSPYAYTAFALASN
jgi:hypothetical protein